ncbi:MAG TPA: dephospho-CoA kinase [Desulfuromonadales bacterium]|nr:dephospho-CoA kinase [Desulfuromonadales bacterium]
MRPQNLSGRRSLILGVTGGIASGKSLVTEIFRSLGALVVSADELAREAVLPGSETLNRLVGQFGREILQADGALDRKALAERVFTNAGAREALNRITHPAIAALAEKRLQELSQQAGRLVVYEAPLLFEAGAEKRVDAVLVVRIDEPLQIERLLRRDGLTEEQARARIAAQMPQAEKVARADYVIDNSGSPEATAEQVKKIFRQLGTLPSPGVPGSAESRE